ncbi:MAG: NAD(P)H-hydrate epimerase, partial [Proteobacteria bacterium]|nr:NAD(P)H-hydrate epimerase [Pseudomonadota bacterium]
MKLVCTSEQVREMDRRVIEDLGLPGIALMELASRAVAQAIVDRHESRARRGVVVVCGGGNNGGDGYGCARWLAAWGYPVSIMALTEKSSGDAAVMRAVCDKMGLATCQTMSGAGLIVDAVFGTGLARDVTGRYAEVLKDMAANPAPVVAVDLPSGLDSDTGAIMGIAVPAATTVTFGYRKCGMFGEPGAGYCGEIIFADIGLAAGGDDAQAEIPERGDLYEYWPSRDPGEYKTRSGHLLVIAGSTAMAGAAVLCCNGALAAGVGLLSLCVPRGAHSRLPGLPPE